MTLVALILIVYWVGMAQCEPTTVNNETFIRAESLVDSLSIRSYKILRNIVKDYNVNCTALQDDNNLLLQNTSQGMMRHLPRSQWVCWLRINNWFFVFIATFTSVVLLGLLLLHKFYKIVRHLYTNGAVGIFRAIFVPGTHLWSFRERCKWIQLIAFAGL